MTTDPGPIADDLCELLFQGNESGNVARASVQLRLAGDALDAVLAEVERRGALDRLLPGAASDEAAAILDVLGAGLGEDGCTRLTLALVRRHGGYDHVTLERVLLRAGGLGVLASPFAAIIGAALYEGMMDLLLREGDHDRPVLRALSDARPDYGREQINAAAVAALRAGGLAPARYDLIVIPGYTPLDVKEPTPLERIPAARGRCDRAIAAFRAGTAARILPSGGAVHPAGTPCNEALMMREYLLAAGVPADRVLVDPHARHSTTNLRNAGRLMRSLGLRRALVITGGESAVFDQSFYFGHPTLSTFAARCHETLGYLVGDLSAEGAGVAFTPSPDVDRPNYADPLDW